MAFLLPAVLALSGQYDKKDFYTYVIVGDGELNEGTTWESALFAAHHQLSRLIVFVDYNKLQGFGRTNQIINLEPFAKKWEAFNWNVQEIDGHNHEDIFNSVKNAKQSIDKPCIIIAHTLKGKGISFMENALQWHYKSLSKEEYQKALKELEE